MSSAMDDLSHARAALAESGDKLVAFIDAWSRWGLSSYVCTHPTERENLRALREAMGMEEVVASESWDVDRLYTAMLAARLALPPPAATGGDE